MLQKKTSYLNRVAMNDNYEPKHGVYERRECLSKRTSGKWANAHCSKSHVSETWGRVSVWPANVMGKFGVQI